MGGNGGGAASARQHEWRQVRGYLNTHRYELSQAAQRLYPPGWRVAGTPMLARPEWIPAQPVPLEDVTLAWRPDRARPGIDGTGPETAAVRPPRADGTRFPSYAAALGALDPPGLLANRACYRILGVDVTGAAARLEFGEGRYFDLVNVCEAVAHEYAAADLARSGAGPAPRRPGRKLREEIGDPTDLTRRPVMTAIATLVLRADRATGQTTMILHWRDPARVASGGGLYQVVPVGVFQPSDDAPWNQANDFSLWRGLLRELSEELLGSGEDYHSDAAPVDYEHWPLNTALTRARQDGRLRVFWLGLGADPLTMATDLLTVAVFEAGLFDATFAGLVAVNDEGRLVTRREETGPAAGVAFDKKEIDFFTGGQPMQAAGAALLRLAWEHRAALLG